jgi:hypothetical protein
MTNNAQATKTFSGIFEAQASDATQLFSAAELHLEKDKRYSAEEVLAAMNAAGYNTTDVEIV